MKRKNLFWVVCLIFFMAIPASAQVNLGVLGGINLANFDVDPLEEGLEFSSITVFGFGGVLDFSLNESVSLRLEPMYLQKGAKATLMIFELEYKFAYLEIPVMVKYDFGTSDIKPYAIAGPTIGYLLSATGKASGGGESREEDMKDVIKSFDFGLGFGAGVSVPMGDNIIFLEARYTIGLTNINDDPEDPEVKTKGIQIFAGITFPVGH